MSDASSVGHSNASPSRMPAKTLRAFVFTDERMREAGERLETQTVPTGAMIELARQEGIELTAIARPWHGDDGFSIDLPSQLRVHDLPDWSGKQPASIVRAVAGLAAASRAARSEVAVLVLPTLSGIVAGAILVARPSPRRRGITVTVNRGSLGPVDGALAGVLPRWLTGLVLRALGRTIGTINARAATATYVSPALVPSPSPRNAVIAPEIDWTGLELATPGGSRDRRRALFVGRLEPEKGCRLAVEAFSRVSTPGVELIVVGAGSLLEELQHRAAELGARVSFVGPLSHQRVLAEMSRAHVLLVPSEHEGFGLVAFEGAVRGCLVLHSGVDGLPEATRGASNAVTVRGTDPVEWAACIEAAFAAPVPATPLSPEALHVLRRRNGWHTLTEAVIDAVADGRSS